MKNKLLILLIAFVFAGCGDEAISQNYEYAGSYNYIHKNVTYTSGQNKQDLVNQSWCNNQVISQRTRYTLWYVVGTNYTGVLVPEGEDPSDSSKWFKGNSNTLYFFEHYYSTGEVVVFEINPSGYTYHFHLDVITPDCPTSILESGNSVADNSNKYSAFNNSCGVPITNYINVSISDNRVFYNNDVFDGQNLYYRTDEYKWIKINSNGYIVDYIFYDCQQGRVLLCDITTGIPIDETSMINVGSFYNLSPPNLSLIDMGLRAGIYAPINFPDDFRGLTHKVYILINAQIETASQCRANLPYNAQTITVTINSSNGLFNGLNLCDDFDVTFTPLSETNFITMNDCNPSGDGEMRMSLNIASSPNVDRGVRVTFSNENLSYSFQIWQLVIQ